MIKINNFKIGRKNIITSSFEHVSIALGFESCDQDKIEEGNANSFSGLSNFYSIHTCMVIFMQI